MSPAGERARDEYLRWAKDRALFFAQRGYLRDAYRSMLNDLEKHPEMRATVAQTRAGMAALANNSVDQIRAWIEAFT